MLCSQEDKKTRPWTRHREAAGHATHPTDVEVFEVLRDPRKLTQLPARFGSALCAP
jgi:hypothetical protein